MSNDFGIKAGDSFQFCTQPGCKGLIVTGIEGLICSECGKQPESIKEIKPVATPSLVRTPAMSQKFSQVVVDSKGSSSLPPIPPVAKQTPVDSIKEFVLTPEILATKPINGRGLRVWYRKYQVPFLKEVETLAVGIVIKRWRVANRESLRKIMVFLNRPDLADKVQASKSPRMVGAGKASGEARKILKIKPANIPNTTDAVKPTGEFQTVVKVKSGGTITLLLKDINPLALSREDRDWLYEIIDNINDYPG